MAYSWLWTCDILRDNDHGFKILAFCNWKFWTTNFWNYRIFRYYIRYSIICLVKFLFILLKFFHCDYCILISNMIGALHLICHERRIGYLGVAYLDASITIPSQATEVKSITWDKCCEYVVRFNIAYSVNISLSF